MKAIIDRDACTGCELCVSMCPAVFEMDADDIAVVIADPVPPSEEDDCKAAADGCPVEAIEVDE